MKAQSPDQIIQAKKFIKSSGMGESQAKSMAKSQGYTDKQIEAAIQNEKNNSSNLDNKEETVLTDQADFFEEEVSNEIKEKEELINIQDFDGFIDSESSPYFGYDIFRGDPSLFQASSVGAVDPSYLIGHGDEIIVMLWGETQFRQVLKVDKEGFIFIPEIGQVFVNGLNLNLLESKLFNVLSQSYATLKPQGATATTFLDISLGNLRPLRIQVLGQVDQPGAYTVSPSSTLFSALYYFNGPKKVGSLRDIRLIRNNIEIGKIDFYDFLLKGKKPNDQNLQLDDVIFIPKRLKTVVVTGDVTIPGIYELKENETLYDLLEITGGLKISAYLNRAQILRTLPFEERNDESENQKIIDIDLRNILNKKDTFLIQDGDELEIFSINGKPRNTITISGAIKREGTYESGQSETILGVIKKAEGLLGNAYIERIDIIRKNPYQGEELIKVNLEEALKEPDKYDVAIQNLDEIIVYSIEEMVQSKSIFIQGHVLNPGEYKLRDNMTVNDLIFLGGGFLDESWVKKTFLKRADLIRVNSDNNESSIMTFNLDSVLNHNHSFGNLKLKANDLIRVYSIKMMNREGFVFIQGGINKPGQYLLKSNMNIDDLIFEANGINNGLNKYIVEVSRYVEKEKKTESYIDIYNFKIDSLNRDDLLFKLKPSDVVSIRSDLLNKSKAFVTIEGEVAYPGRYALKNSSEKLSDIIKRAGGLNAVAYEEGSSFIRNNNVVKLDIKKVLRNNRIEENVSMQSGDKIIIAMNPNMIQIVGEANSPGYYSFKKNKKVSYYLKRSGGFSQNAESKNIWVEYPDGKSTWYKPFLSNPKVLDGSVIHIGKEKDQEEFDLTQFSSDISSLIVNLLQVVLIISAINQ